MRSLMVGRDTLARAYKAYADTVFSVLFHSAERLLEVLAEEIHYCGNLLLGTLPILC